MTKPTEIKTWHILLAILIVVGGSAARLHELLSAPPDLAVLQHVAGGLDAPVALVHNSGRSGSGPYASFVLGKREYRLRDLCFLSECALPSEMASLRSGTVVHLWVEDRAIWQVATADSVLVSYSAIRNAQALRKKRMLATFGPLIGIALLTLPLLAYRQLRARSSACT